MNPLRQSIKWAMSALLPRRCWLVSGRGLAQNAALTFDDGPDPDVTPRILDELAAQGLRATFFVVGRAAQLQPGLVRRIVDEGHGLGNHTWFHREPDSVSVRQLADEIQRTRRLLADITGRDVALFRPPQGKLTLRKLLAAWKLRQTVVLWNVDPRDYRASPEERAEWAARYRPSAGDVVLLHDNRSASLDLLQRMRPALARIECGLIEDWLRPKEFNPHGRPSVEKRLQEVAR